MRSHSFRHKGSQTGQMADVEADLNVLSKTAERIVLRRRFQPFRLSKLQLVVEPQLEAATGKNFCMGVV